MRPAVGLLAIAISVAAVVPAAAAGIPLAGERLVDQYCVRCHKPATAQTMSDQAPSLAFLAKVNREKGNRRWIRAWLAAPHPPMEGLGLANQQIDDIIAYLDTLPDHKG